MPWLAVTLKNVPTVLQNLSPKYKVKGIPHLVILDGDDATVITLDGRTVIAKDPYGLEYPWKPRTLLSLVPKPLRRILKSYIDRSILSFQSTFKGVLESLAPANIVTWIVNKLKKLSTYSMDVVMKKVNEAMSANKSKGVVAGTGKVTPTLVAALEKADLTSYTDSLGGESNRGSSSSGVDSELMDSISSEMKNSNVVDDELDVIEL